MRLDRKHGRFSSWEMRGLGNYVHGDGRRDGAVQWALPVWEGIRWMGMVVMSECACIFGKLYLICVFVNFLIFFGVVSDEVDVGERRMEEVVV